MAVANARGRQTCRGPRWSADSGLGEAGPPGKRRASDKCFGRGDGKRPKRPLNIGPQIHDWRSCSWQGSQRTTVASQQGQPLAFRCRHMMEPSAQRFRSAVGGPPGVTAWGKLTVT